MSRTLCCTADLAPGSLAQRIRFGQLEAAHKAGAALAAFVFIAVLLIAVGKTFGILISNTDSAASAGVYRIVTGGFGRGDLVARCLPIAIAQEGLARGYLRTGHARAMPSRSASS
jgi:type IV secretory pathway protease TraF